MASNAAFTLDPEQLSLLYINEGLTPGMIAERLGCSATKVRKSLKALGLLGVGRAPYRRHSSCERALKRRGCEFTPEVKRRRFQEEGGRCQLCGDPIEGWEDRGPAASAVYHHIRMVCEGGDGSSANCMVLHKTCHGGKGTGLPLNPVLHNGRRFSYAYKVVLALCRVCGALRRLNNAQVCARCSHPSTPLKTCETCGCSFKSKSPMARFCSNKCRGVALAAYTEDDLRREAPLARGKRDLMRRLGLKTLGGGTLQRLNRELERLGLNCGGRF